MKKTLLTILILGGIGFFSCKQSSKPTKDITKKETSDSTKNIQNKEIFNDKDIYSQFEYLDNKDKKIIIQNGLPRGGMKYTDAKGDVYNYAVFWTNIINETDHTFELNFNIPLNAFEVPSLPGKYYEVIIPEDTMTIKKFPVYLYGLKNLESFLDDNVHKLSHSKRIIKPKESTAFYFVILCLVDGAHGTMRTGLSIKKENLFYKIKIDGSNSNSKSNEKEVNFGHINLKNLRIKE
ncbi:hypothetical protein [Flavobacterium gyeonganense]|uniref:Lipoprotein n=1 Tax=Flavobacterium gyeonganense TaxID=1310418 RepID=A0ABV5H8T1_9FLAO|nr:hypothetical protein [Flavobacterium gyeonganense]